MQLHKYKYTIHTACTSLSLIDSFAVVHQLDSQRNVNNSTNIFPITFYFRLNANAIIFYSYNSKLSLHIYLNRTRPRCCAENCTSNSNRSTFVNHNTFAYTPIHPLALRYRTDSLTAANHYRQ